MYFNKRNERTGSLFEGPFKAKHIDRQEYATYLTQYIHLNPIDLFQAKPGTKEDVIKKTKEYEWSTLPDYLGNKGRLSLLLGNGIKFREEVLDMSADQYRIFLHEIYRDSYQAKPGTKA